jgi:Tfp pilus assembly protein PilN
MSQHLNLLVAGLRPQRRCWTLAQGLVGLAALAAAGLLAGLGLDYLADQARADLGISQQAAEVLRQRLASLQAPDGPAAANLVQAELAALRRQASALDQARQLITSGAAGQPIGHADLLMALARQSDPAVWLTGLKVSADHATLELRGRMNDPAALPGYLGRLQGEPLFHGRRFAQLGLRRVDAGADGQAGSSGPIEFTLRSAVDAAPAQPRPGGVATP